MCVCVCVCVREKGRAGVRVSVRTYLSVGVVGVPGGPERLLAPNIPHEEVGVLHHYLLHVAADGG